jgi:holo-[acyl-carrier protein] synthase
LKLRTGVDIVDIQGFCKQIKATKSAILKKYLHKQEIDEGKSLESLAGKFAAKEAIIKTGIVKPGDWLKILIKKQANGRPEVYLKKGSKFIKGENIDISISHDGDYVIAFAVYIS